MDNEELAKWIGDEIRQAKVKSADWRRNARECYDFYAGKQWSDEDASKLEIEGRPAVVFNRTARTINAIAGLEVQNRQEVRYIPRGTEDAPVNDLLTGAAKWVMDNCDAQDEESESFQDTLIAGMGWTDTSLDYETNPDGMIIVERDDPLSYFWDSNAKKRNLDDMKWVAKAYRMTRKQVGVQWPSWSGNVSDGDLLDEEDSPHDATPPFYDKSTENKGTQKTIEVLCFQWFEKETFHRVQTPDGKILELSPSKFSKIKDSLDAMGVSHVTQKRNKYYKAYKIGNEIVEKGDLEIQKGFTFKCITGLRDRNNNTWFGLVSLMLDPQRWANKWLSQIMHILNSNSKGGLLAEVDAFVNIRKAEKEWADPSAITWMAQGGLAKVKQKEISQMPSGVENLLKYALESIDDVPGINSELLGLADRQQAGVLENSRKQAGITMLAIFFDSLRRYRKKHGRVLAEFIVTYIADGRLIRMAGPDGEKSVPLLKDPLTFEFDIIVDDSPTSTNQKEKTFAVLMQLAPQLAAAGVTMPRETIDYLPIPDGLIQKWKEQLNPDKEMMEQQKQQQKQDMMEQAQIQVQIKQMEEQPKLDLEKYKAELEASTRKEIAEMQAGLEMKKCVMSANAAKDVNSMTMLDDEGNEQPIDAISNLVDSVNQNMAIMNQAHQEQSMQLAQMMQAMAMNIMQKMDEPKVIKRNNKGKAIAINDRTIIRDSGGSITRLQ